MIAAIIKNGRLAKGLTQKELSAQTNISIRSIQRIESAALLPRSYTLKAIAGVLDIPLSDLITTETAPETDATENTALKMLPRKIILSVFIPVILLLASLAFISQSATFPETGFEGFVFWAIVCLFIGAALYYIWQPVKANR